MKTTFVDEQGDKVFSTEAEAQKYMRDNNLLGLEVYLDDIWTGQILSKEVK